MFTFETMMEPNESTASDAAAPNALDAPDPMTAPTAAPRQMVALDANARRMRDRYLAARFLQMSEPRLALRKTEDMLRWARQMVEDDKAHQAAELLTMALEEDSSQRELWLFLIELSYIAGEATEFGELVDAFQLRFENDPLTATIRGMGAAIMPDDPRFLDVEPIVEPPKWSEPTLTERNDLFQQKFHGLLQEALAHYTKRGVD